MKKWSQGAKPEGSLDGEGTISFADVKRPKIDLTFDMHKFYLDYFIENTSLLISSDELRISGRDTINVTGKLELSGEYIPDLDILKKRRQVRH